MDNYKNMYYMLFNKMTDIIDEIKTIQKQSEELFILQEMNRTTGQSETSL